MSGRSARGAAARLSGRRAEVVAAIWLMAKGYRILGFRLKSRAGEIDILARRGRVLAVVEVKRRKTMQAALSALTPHQTARLVAAAQQVVRGRKALQALEIRLDLVALAPGRFPRHRRGVGA